ncbi:MAG: hypothetical protein EBX39_04885 [Actinobacteria bacterium]|nr:hypothetical protein [Actinomycetota bacterium]
MRADGQRPKRLEHHRLADETLRMQAGEPPGRYRERHSPWLQLEAGEGAGVHAASGALCHSAFARRLLECNLRPHVPAGQGVRLRLTLPRGRALAER